MSDVLLQLTADGPAIQVKDGYVTQTEGFETAVVLSLFGGNIDGSDWWGDLDNPRTTEHNRSITGPLIQGLPLTPENLRRVEDAVRTDLAPLGAPDLSVSATFGGVNKLNIAVFTGARVLLSFEVPTA